MRKVGRTLGFLSGTTRAITQILIESFLGEKAADEFLEGFIEGEDYGIGFVDDLYSSFLLEEEVIRQVASRR